MKTVRLIQSIFQHSAYPVSSLKDSRSFKLCTEPKIWVLTQEYAVKKATHFWWMRPRKAIFLVVLIIRHTNKHRNWTKDKEIRWNLVVVTTGGDVLNCQRDFSKRKGILWPKQENLKWRKTILQTFTEARELVLDPESKEIVCRQILCSVCITISVWGVI